MTKLVWGATGERFFETGVDRGVLYVGSDPGVPWNGLVNISESTKGRSLKEFYYDGVKYLNLLSAEEFSAKLSAVSFPDEFAPCEGLVSLQNGLYASEQPKSSFSLSYRTMIGNDVSQEAGYKIHLVYNALAARSDRVNATIGDSPTPSELSWDISTLPPPVSGIRRTSHFVIDSIKTPPALLSSVEDLLYGTVSTDPQIPTAQALVDMFAP